MCVGRAYHACSCCRSRDALYKKSAKHRWRRARRERYACDHVLSIFFVTETVAPASRAVQCRREQASFERKPPSPLPQHIWIPRTPPKSAARAQNARTANPLRASSARPATSEHTPHDTRVLARCLHLLTASNARLGITGSFFCSQECFKGDCETLFALLNPERSEAHQSSRWCRRGTLRRATQYRIDAHHSLAPQKAHKIVHDIATPRQPLLNDPSINNSA
jgi:hypothetical protein